ncbi:MAG TPA: nucleotidyltransferase domain-containing protein [Firmicutes bacterium]|nr:nucleotidyltransferase domain-containing protein [Bacillota bacterium]
MDRVLLSRIENAINEFCRLLRERLGRNLVDIRLFGSVARGTFTAESDIDILVVLHDEDRLSRETVIEAAVDINLEYDVVISPVIMSMRHYSDPLLRETLFYRSIQGEGVSL